MSKQKYKGRDYYNFRDAMNALPTFQEKAAYIWEYYKYWICGGIAVLLFIITMSVSIYQNSAPVYLNGDYINVMGNSFSDTYDRDYLQNSFLYGYLGLSEDDRTCMTFNDTFSMVPDNNVGEQATNNYNARNAIMAHLAAHETDYFLMTPNVIDSIQIQFECLMDMREFLTVEELEQYQDLLYYTSDGIPVAIDITDTQFVTNAQLIASDHIYLSWVVFSERREHFRPFFDYIMGAEAQA